MTHDYLVQLDEVTQKLRQLRDKLPNITPDDLRALGEHLNEFDLNDVSPELMEKLQSAFAELTIEVDQIIKGLDEQCAKLREGVDSIETQKKAAKAYAKTQHAN
jgi:DNA repair exonuclease SbcCD ATPase subunit